MEAFYEVEAIQGKKLIDDRVHYLVKWLNYNEAENSWEPAENLEQCKQLVKEFDKQHVQPEDEDLRFVQSQICKLLKCFVCGCVLDYNARSHKCGVSRCGVCIENEDLFCSCSDQEDKDTDWTPITKELKNQVDALEVYCPNQRYGCRRTKPMGELQQHLDNTCLFTAVCDKCGEFICKKQTEQHKRDVCSMREVKCPWCFEKGLAKEIDEHERNLALCVKAFANMLEHPLVRGNNKRKAPQPIEDFIVDDDYIEIESKRTKQRKAKNGNVIECD